jgi:hypothetical protein
MSVIKGIPAKELDGFFLVMALNPLTIKLRLYYYFLFCFYKLSNLLQIEFARKHRFYR